jgi:DNA-binding MarR family transcriptional regulator
MTTTDLPAVEALVLTRLLPVSEKGDTSAKIKKDLEPLLGHRASGAAITETVEQAIGNLEAAGFVTLQRGRTKRSVPRVILTLDGRRRALTFLGIDVLKPKTTWTTLKKVHLPARVLGIPAASDATIKAISSDPVFKAVLLKREYDLAAAVLPRLDDVIDALAWRLMGFGETPRKLDLKTVKTALLNRELGDGRAADFKKAVSQLLARRLRARRDDPRELRDAVLRGWIDRDPTLRASGEEKPKIPPVFPVSAAPTFDLAKFAERVKAAAEGCDTGRYGDNKVFIAHVWNALQSDPFFQGMDLATFKAHLAEANNARLLDLSRADLVQAMNPDDVRQSEVRYLSASFHFVRI